MGEIARVGIVGAGTMGKGLALFLPQRGLEVVLVTRRRAALVRAECAKTLAGLVRRGALSEEAAREVSRRLQVTQEMELLRGAELVVECVEEEQEKKEAVLARVSQEISPPTLLATVASSLRISRLAESVRGPTRFLGLHFFNPVARMELVEVAPGPETEAEAVARAVVFVEGLGKTALLVRDTPGFIVNRLVLELCNRAVGLVEEETAGPEAIDAAMRLGCGHPMGPLELGDAIGWDIVLTSLGHLHEATGEAAYRPRPLLRRLVSTRRLGRKVGQGVYRYDPESRQRLSFRESDGEGLGKGAEDDTTTADRGERMRAGGGGDDSPHERAPGAGVGDRRISGR